MEKNVMKEKLGNVKETVMNASINDVTKKSKEFMKEKNINGKGILKTILTVVRGYIGVHLRIFFGCVIMLTAVFLFLVIMGGGSIPASHQIPEAYYDAYGKEEVEDKELVKMVDHFATQGARFTVEFFEIMDSYEFNRYYNLENKITEELDNSWKMAYEVNTNFGWELNETYSELLTALLDCINSTYFPSDALLNKISFELVDLVETYEDLTGKISEGRKLIATNPLFTE